MSEEKRTDNYADFLSEIDKVKEQAQREKLFLEGITKVSGVKTAPDEPGLVGDRVRSIREKNGLTLADVASRTGYDQAFLASIEANEVSPPLGVLIKLGKALDMKMGYFISGGETKPFTVVRASERQQIARRASSKDQAYGYTYQALAPNKTDRHMEPFLVTLEPSTDKALSAHEGQEFIFVLEGKMEAILDQDRVVLEPGDAIYYDSNVPHLVRCADGPFARILAVLYAYDK
jgi:transcriptional regulator with XRE-family HTH domain